MQDADRMRRVLLPHQSEALLWARGRSRVAFFHQMRLGKTLTTIRWVEQLPLKDKPKLVVAPLPVLATWVDELRLEGYEPVVLRGGPLERAEKALAAPAGSWFLTNYEGLVDHAKGSSSRVRPAPLMELPWTCTILDESPKIKSPTAQVSKVACSQFRSKYRAILSGLPNPEGSQDLFCQMQYLLSGTFMGHRNFWGWRDQYFFKNRWEWSPKLGATAAIRKAVTEHAHWLTRKECDMGSPQVYGKRMVALPKSARLTYNRVASDFVLGGMSTNWSIVCHTWLAQIAGGVAPPEPAGKHREKIKELCYLLQGELRNKPVVVWFRFNDEIDGVLKALIEKGVTSAAPLWGVDDVRKRDTAVKAFQSGRRDILLAQVKCATFGLDFSRARTAIYFSPVWSHQEMAQTMDRIIHPLKRDTALLLFLLAEDTVDEKCYDAIRSKQFNSSLLKRDVLAHVRVAAAKYGKK